MSLYMYMYDNNSENGLALRDALAELLGQPVPIIRHQNSQFKGHPDKTVINWGASELPYEVRKCTVLNNERAVAACVDKRVFNTVLNEAYRVHQTTPRRLQEALNQLGRAAFFETIDRQIQTGVYFVRTRAQGRDGQGLEAFDNYESFLARILFDPDTVRTDFKYITYCPVRDWTEYRVIAGLQEDDLGTYASIFSVQEKVRQQQFNPELHSEYIRTSGNMWGYTPIHDRDIKRLLPRTVRDVVLKLELAFAGFDIITYDHDGERYVKVLEANTAPHLTPYALRQLSAKLSPFSE